MDNNIRYQSVTINRANLDNGYAEEAVSLDRAYGKVTGVRAYLVAAGGQTYIEIGLKDKDNMFHNLSPNADWQPTVDYFYKPLNIRHYGQQFIIATSLPGANTSDLKLILVFRLEN